MAERYRAIWIAEDTGEPDGTTYSSACFSDRGAARRHAVAECIRDGWAIVNHEGYIPSPRRPGDDTHSLRFASWQRTGYEKFSGTGPDDADNDAAWDFVHLFTICEIE